MKKEDLIYAKNLKKYFEDKGYNCIKPYQISNNTDTVFLTAGIQPLLSNYRLNRLQLNNCEKIYLSQPVIRTQYQDSISEGSAIAFINSTTAGFNISESEHNQLVYDWIDLFYLLGFNSKELSSSSKEYIRNWGDLLVEGKKTFFYYKGIELGDTTFFTRITKNGENIGLDSMSDVGFGLERIRWCLNNKSYFDVYSESNKLTPEIKAYLSAIALLTVNDILPGNKNTGYRSRQFSKKLTTLLSGRSFNELENLYLNECITYWKDWQEKNIYIDINVIKTEYMRNCNRYIIDLLIKEGYANLNGININISRDELDKRLLMAGVESSKVKKLVR